MRGTVIEVKVTNVEQKQICCLFEFGKNEFVSIGLITGVTLVEGDVLSNEGGKWSVNGVGLKLPGGLPSLKNYAEAKAEFDEFR
ncbi:hypothetical protein HZI30_05420 [Serratia fonticola]|uniref:hypothetical protein n=1 Tax=Serratia fonticola TaxID=47917 RepID=UPI0015C5D8BC|nr:hypothetical protein [Serratia fonticola]NXZ86375.1 hypothetical protein [Serratia fonticola]